MVCKEHGKGECRRRSVTYQTTCDTCRARNAAAGLENTSENVGAYWGESHRSAAERSEEHLHDLRAQKEDSHMWKHKLLEHPEEEVTFSMKVLKKHYSAFERMVTESTLITHNHNTSNILNSKSGYNRSCIPRLTVSMGQRVVADSLNNNDYTNEEVEEMMENDIRRARKSRGRDKGGNDIQVPPQNPPSKRFKVQARRTQSHTKFIPKDRTGLEKVGPGSNDTVQLARQTSTELDHSEIKATTPSDSNLRMFSIFSKNGIGGKNLSSEAGTSSQREFRKPGRKSKVTPPPINNYKFTDIFKPNPRRNDNSDRPNEPVVEDVRSEEKEDSSVLDEPAAVTRPIGL